MDSLWEYNAPQFVDFTKHVDDDHADEYFDVNHEMEVDNFGVDVTIKLIDEPADMETEASEANTAVQMSSPPLPLDAANMVTINAAASDRGDTDTSTYEDALAELSTTKTPVLPTRSVRATPLRRSTRKNTSTDPQQSIALDNTILPDCDHTPVIGQLKSRIKKASLPAAAFDDKLVKQNPTANAEESRLDNKAQSAEKPVEVLISNSAHYSVVQSNGRKAESASTDARGPCLRPRTRSLDHINTSDLEKGSSRNAVRGASSCRNLSAVGASQGRGGRCQSEDREKPLARARKSPCPLATPPVGKARPTTKLTIPQTPQFLKRELKFLHVAPVQSSEQLEMEKIRTLRRALADKRRLAEESRIKALAATGYTAAVRSAQPLTEPLGFHFATDDRLKVHEMETRQDLATALCRDFTSDLRHYAPATIAMLHTTQPQPFNLHAERKRKFSESDAQQPTCTKFESVAEKVAKFCTQTPERFRRRSPACNSSLNRGSHAATDDNKQLTVAKTPNLETRKRSRPVSVISQAEREEMELEEAKRHQFHANPVNQKILANPMLGIKKVLPKECTVPEEFHLEIEDRLRQRKAADVAVAAKSSEVFEFHARPVPKAIRDGPVGVHPPKQIPLTVPQSPAFATRRAVTANSSKEHEPEPEPVRVRPPRAVPHAGIPFQPRFDHHTTEVVPFSFDERDKEMFMRKEEKIVKVLEEEKKAREFHANPMKDLTPLLPPKKIIPITEPEPFDLEVDIRGAIKAEERKKQLEEEAHMVKRLATFKARLPTVLATKPYIPQKSVKPLTEILEPQLKTERRAETRLEWEKWRHEKESDAALERYARERQRELDELNEARRLRAEAVHRANPVRHYRPIEIVPSSQPLTLPASPRFSDRLRSRTVHQ